MSMLRNSILRATRASAPRSLRPFTPIRNYAEKKDMSAISGDQTPQASSNVRNPDSVNANQQSIKNSRGLESENSPDTGSVASPVDSPTGARTAQQEDDTSTNEAFNQDSDKSAAEKRKKVEEQGQKPLDAANK